MFSCDFCLAKSPSLVLDANDQIKEPSEMGKQTGLDESSVYGEIVLTQILMSVTANSCKYLVDVMHPDSSSFCCFLRFSP